MYMFVTANVFQLSFQFHFKFSVQDGRYLLTPSGFTIVFAAKGCIWLHASQSIPSQTQFLQEVYEECKNDSISDLCVILGGQPLFSMCEWCYFHCQSGGGDFVGTTVFMCSPSIFPDSESLSRQVSCDWAICEDHAIMRLAAEWALVFLCWSPHCQFATTRARFWQQSLIVGFSLCQTAQVLDWLFCLAHAWLAPFSQHHFFSLVASWIGLWGFYTSVHFGLFHLLFIFIWWKI